MAQTVLTSPEVAHKIGVAPRMPTLWAERGYLSPSVQDADGRGSQRLWSLDDVLHAYIVKMLIAHICTRDLRALNLFVRAHPKALQPGTVWRIDLTDRRILRVQMVDTVSRASAVRATSAGIFLIIEVDVVCAGLAL